MRKKVMLLLSVLLFFLSCELFKPGLGDKVDIEIPLLNIVSPANGEYASSTVAIEGTYDEDTGIASIGLSLDGGSQFQNAEVDTQKRTWRFMLDTTQYPDGEKDIIARVVDITNKSSEKKLLLRLDNTPPMILVKDPFYIDNKVNCDVSLKGEATDTFGVYSVEVAFFDASGKAIRIGNPAVAPTVSRRSRSLKMAGIVSRAAYRDLTRSTMNNALADGTNSWSFLFRSMDYITDSGQYNFVITARDYANNVSTVMYHYNDVLGKNNQQAVTIENLYKLLIGKLPSDPNMQITLADLQSIALSQLTLTIDQSLDLPHFKISNPDEAGLPSEKILGGNDKINGLVEDDDSVDSSSIRICIDPVNPANPDAPGNIWTNIGGSGGSGLSLRWEYDSGSLVEGVHQLWVRALDIYGVEGLSNVVEFYIDRGAPSIAVTYPVQGDYLNNDFILTGTATDGDTVASVEVSLNDGVDYFPAALTGQDWTYPVAIPANNNMKIKVKAMDRTGKVAYYNLLVFADKTPPDISFLTPRSTSTVNGEVIFKGTANDTNQLTGVELKIGNSDPWIMLADIYSWEYTIDSMSYANAIHAVNQGGDVWKLDVQARATDIAGNIGYVTGYYILIDNNMDKPTVSIISPCEGQNIGGPVLISGTAFDDDMVHSVRMQIDINGDGDFNDQIDIYNGTSSTKDGDTNDKFEQENQWYTVEGTTLWTEQINNYGELYETEPGHTGNITIRVQAIDTKDGLNPDIAGNYQELHITLDNTIPRIENLNLNSGDYVKGTFILSGNTLDDQHINNIMLSYNGGLSYEDITGNALYVTMNSEKDYTLHIPVNSVSYIPASGIFYLRLKVIDDANYQTISYINLNVDNLYPTGSFTSSTSDIYGSTDHARLQGEAVDTGTVNGIKEVELYFIRGGNVYSPVTGAVDSTTTVNFGDGNGDVLYTTDPAFKIIIDNKYEFGSDAGGNGDHDGFNESISLSGNTYNWWAEFNSAVITDGTVDIHYVVFDNAGNGHHYVQNGFIKNHKPVISSVTVGSDIDQSNTVEADEQFTYSVPITARNRLYIAINASDPGGGIVSYAVYHDPAGANTLVQTTQAGTLNISGYTEGPTSFLCRITDTDGITAEYTIQVTINNSDTVNPQIVLAPLTTAHAVNGHIEVAGTSLYDGTDADVSGTLKFTGTAEDNHRISSIKVTIENFNAGDGVGVEHTVASWSGGQLVSMDGNFTIDTQSLTEAGGHDVTWSYTWNTANISNSAGPNIDISFKVTDFAARTGTSPMTVDVVPYITSLGTYLTNAFSAVFDRSALGKYPVLVDSTNGSYETITVYGYNLHPVNTGAGSDVRLSTDPDGLNAVGTKIGTGLPYSNVSAGYTSLNATIQAAGSGYLNVIVNGVPSINNINGEIAANSEANYINDHLYDDRYLNVWDIRKLWQTVPKADKAVFPSMAMKGNTPAFAYVNNVEGYGQARYWDGTTDKQIYDNWDLFTYSAIDFNSSGNHAVLFDINVVNGNYGDYNSGNYGGILTSFYYDVPAHTWSSCSDFKDYHLWLENLVDITDPKTTAVLDRYQYPDMVVNGNTAITKVFYSVYDRLDNRLLFRTFRVGTDATLDDTTGGKLTDTATDLYTDLPQYDATSSFPDYSSDRRFTTSATAGMSPPGAQVIATNTGESSAVACTSNGSTALIVYYDANGMGSLVYKYNTTPTDSGTWSGGITLASGTGCEFIDMAVDSSNHIHIAYYDSYAGDVKYVYIPAYNSPAGNIVKCTVDSYLIVGEKLTIDVSGAGVPFITYKGIGHSAKVAWRNGAPGDGADGSGKFTGAWEIQILPSSITDSDSNRFNIGLDTAGLPVVGYSNSGIEYIRLLAGLSE